MSFVSDAINTVVNVATQTVTGGMVSYENGKFGKGFTGHGIDEAIGEVTGRNQARKSLFEQKDAVNAAATEAERLRQEEIKRRGIQQTQTSQEVAASRVAGAVSTSSGPGIGSDSGGGGNPLNSFLGLP